MAHRLQGLAILSILGAAAWAVLAGRGEDRVPDKLPVVEKIAHENYTQKVNDKVSLDMIAIPGGVYRMGSPVTEKDRGEEEGPQRVVRVKPFWMAKVEITWDVYDYFWSKRPGGPPPRPDTAKKPDKLSDALTSPTPPYDDETFGHGRDGYPVIAVTHHAAMEFCRWLSKETGKRYRLPTEAEWEWACRAGTTTTYHFGDDASKLGEYEWYRRNSEDMSHPVGKKKPNPWGLHDMAGSVAEWCLDSYSKDFFDKLPKDKITLNPFTPPVDRRYPDTVRGGSWDDDPVKCRSAIRRFSEKKWLKRDPQRPQSIWWMTDAEWVGFRVIRPVEEDERLKDVRSLVNWWSKD